MAESGWRHAITSAENAVAPHLDDVLRSSEAARIGSLAVSVRRGIGTRVRSVVAHAWELVNGPTADDIHELRREVGALDREIRRLVLRLDEQSHRSPEA